MRTLVGFLLVALTGFLSASSSLAVVYVDRNSPGPAHDGTSWDTAFLKIQDGVNAATPDCEVWVADGTYVENVVMGTAVQLYGGFLGAEPGGYETNLSQRDFTNHVTTIDGNKQGSCVIMAVNAVVDGFTLRNGIGAFVVGTRYGGGVYCSNLGDHPSQSTAIRNNVIIGNTADGGGAVCCWTSSPTITNNTITGNSAGPGGGVYCCYSAPTIANNTITGNSASQGGGVYCWTSSPAITNNTIADNSAGLGGGGIYCGYYSLPSIANNTITGNLAVWGAAVCCERSSSPTIKNNTILGNSAYRDGGAVQCDDSSSPAITNNIIVDNTAMTGVGGGICGDPALTCNDVWGNTSDDYYRCDPGIGDISQNPLFADPDGPDGDPDTWEDNDYHLSPGSPCIDKGSNAALGLPYQDFEGDPRACDGNGDAVAIVDMGADEYRLEFESNGSPADWFVAGWVWFSIPLVPRGSADASDVLGYACRNRVYAWDDARKSVILYPDDFTDLAVGPSYLARLDLGEEYQPIYEGSQPQLPFEWTLPAAGSCWVGVPGTQDIFGSDLRVKKDGALRTPTEDKAAPDPWLNWNWIFWDPVQRTAKLMDPFGGGDDTWLHPWWGYRVWANTPDVTIVFP